jgi:hypothetical protein
MNRLAAALAFVLAGAVAQLTSAASIGLATGTITAVSGSTVTMKTRTGAMMTVDATKAQDDDLSVVLYGAEPITVHGSLDASGVLHATAILRAKPQSLLWPPDTLGPAAGVQ